MSRYSCPLESMKIKNGRASGAAKSKCAKEEVINLSVWNVIHEGL
jgi:hypothetical protein